MSKTDDNVQQVCEVLNSDLHLSMRIVQDNFRIDKITVHAIIIENLTMRKICAKFVPKILTDDQKQRRVSACEDVLQAIQEDPNSIANVATEDKSWIFKCDPETKRYSSKWHTAASSRPKNARMNKSRVKTMLIVFFNAKVVRLGL